MAGEKAGKRGENPALLRLAQLLSRHVRIGSVARILAGTGGLVGEENLA
jgi:hypothetical protein